MFIYVLNLSFFSVLGVKKLYDDCFHELKIIPLHSLNKFFGSSFKLHSNFYFESKLFKDFSILLQAHANGWKKYSITPPITPTCVLSQFLWYNGYIKIDNKAVYLKNFQQRILIL